MRLIIILASALLFLLLVIPFMPTANADPPAVTRVFAPTAWYAYDYGVTLGYGKDVMLDNERCAITVTNGFSLVSNFTFPGYDDYWAPFDNRTAFPPNNATILSVSMVTVLRCAIAQPFFMSLEFWNHTTDSYTQITTGGWSPLVAGATEQLYSVNITSYQIWNATILKSAARWGLPYWEDPDETYGVKIGVHIGTYYSKPLYIDYIGLDYTWKYANESSIPPGGPESTGPFTLPDVMGLMGITGFIGMVGVVPASIWFFRRDGGSKVYAGVMALVAFTVCLGFFLASINGG